MMRLSVVFLNRFYWPDVAATGQQLTDLAEDLAAAGGYDVSVITSRTAYEIDGSPVAAKESRRGVRIVRVRTTRFGRARALGRVLDYVPYMCGALWELLRMPRPDVIVACSDP